ncbi:MAG: heparan-alpha-glucosaminide N-acetyltransferase domain-containing protein [Cellvibrionales bacterium]|nr:heparan-alpha-glucosaminide N-acetyltransferase domain-containing protein [Cellvibrionales bacterium]
MKTSSPPRFKVVDYGRGLAVLLMIFVHTLWMYADKTVQNDSMLGTIIHFVGKGTAAFLFLMGLSMVLSTRQSLKHDCLRGLLILAFAYVMNALKFIVPISVFGTMPESFVNAYGWQSPLNTSQLLYLLGTGDILQMVGISLFLIGIIRHFVANPWIILALGLCIAAVSGELRGLANHHENISYLGRLFFSNHYQVYFPIFPWMSFILFGLAFGKWLVLKNFEHKKLFDASLIIGFAGCAIGGGFMAWDFEYHFNNFFHAGFGGVLYLIGVNMLLFYGIHRIVEARIDNPFTRFLGYLSKRVTSIYIIQWVLICWGMGIIGFNTLSAGETLAMMPVMLALSIGVQWLKEKLFSLFKRPVSKTQSATSA